MKAWVNLYVDISNLDIDYVIHRYTETSEHFGQVRTDNVVEVEIKTVAFNGVVTDDFDYEEIEQWILENEVWGE